MEQNKNYKEQMEAALTLMEMYTHNEDIVGKCILEFNDGSALHGNWKNGFPTGHSIFVCPATSKSSGAIYEIVLEGASSFYTAKSRSGFVVFDGKQLFFLPGGIAFVS